MQALAPLQSGGGAGEGTIAAERYGSWGFDTAGMDRSVDPGTDFFAYASGNWARTTQIPSDQSSYGNFRVLRDLSEARVRKLLDGYPKADPATGGDAAKIATLYQDFLDEAAIEARGDAPLQPLLAQLREALSLPAAWQEVEPWSVQRPLLGTRT